ncbi:MAG TPA: MarR family winged helix-turn-helix transcriptional regulator [Candidatus Borkfalkia excrementigallinarum]|uniref:MarR family winged helix-turn-helix transcriptional regulator n=1 Tax=Candidatus Borkfalkia excrementigallinarum TaxID=2838506 RepID=A0A9D1ZWJ6_9FIRM|nr:MarR family winged helix-turn-helix transcriptional regulator [Candidatus Borkfalkia excrementigallinarum]
MDKRHIGYAVNSLGRRISRVMNNIPAIKENKNLTGIQIWVLNFLFRSEGKDVFQRDVEREFNIRRSTATELLKMMERGGLICREPVDYDARLKKIVLTAYAEEIRKQLQAQIRKTETLMTEGFTDEEIEQFFSFVERFKSNLKKCE